MLDQSASYGLHICFHAHTQNLAANLNIQNRLSIELKNRHTPTKRRRAFLAARQGQAVFISSVGWEWRYTHY